MSLPKKAGRLPMWTNRQLSGGEHRLVARGGYPGPIRVLAGDIWVVSSGGSRNVGRDRDSLRFSLTRPV